MRWPLILVPMLISISALPTGCEGGDEEDVDKAIESAAEQFAEGIAKSIPRLSLRVKSWARECPSCGGTAKLEGDDDNHRWWKCSDLKCSTKFGEYTRDAHAENSYGGFKGYCTFYAADRWLQDGNPWMFPPGRAPRARKWWHLHLLRLTDNDLVSATRRTTPAKGAIVVFEDAKASWKDRNDGDLYGHVAYVENCDKKGGSFTILQMNAGPDPRVDSNRKTQYFGLVTRVTITKKKGGKWTYGIMPVLGFIHPSDSSSAGVAEQTPRLSPNPQVPAPGPVVSPPDRGFPASAPAQPAARLPRTRS